MSSNEQSTQSKTTNRHSIISLVLGILTLLIFCGSIIIPIPFTSFICAPFGALIGLAALIYGLVSLQRIKKHNQTGHPMAWVGILIGAFVLLCMLCATAAFISLFYLAPDSLHNFPAPPFIKDFQI